MDLQLNKSNKDLVTGFLSLRSARDVAELLEIPYTVLNYHLYVVPVSRQYKTFTIPKKSGGYRNICAPITHIKIIQKKLNRILQEVYTYTYKRNFLVHGFRCGKSVRSNAEVHKNRAYILNVDLLNFFPSINFGRVYGRFKSKPYMLPSDVTRVLARICCYKDSDHDFLPQGAPTSPIVSNIICDKMDNELYRFARDFQCRYTRYADDMTFSTNRPNFPAELANITRLEYGCRFKAEVGQELNSIIKENSFLVNTRKVRIQHRYCRQKVTGLTVNEFPNISRKYTNTIRAMLHDWEKNGLPAAENRFVNDYDKKKRWPYEPGSLFKSVVKGKINFLKMVRGDQNPTYQKFAGKLATLDPDFSFVRIIREADSYNLKDAVFVLESHRGQGTAFMLRGIGLVTSAHNLENDKIDTYLYKMDESADKQRLKVKHVNTSLDVATIEVAQGWAKASLVRGDSTNLKIGDTVKVIGFPNYAEGKSIHIHEGQITGRGRWYEVQTFNVSARIIYGNSGGPVLNDKNEVIGIAFYGAPDPEKADYKESGLIPIELLDKLI